MTKKKKDINEVLEDLQDVNKVELPKQASLPDQSEGLGCLLYTSDAADE